MKKALACLVAVTLLLTMVGGSLAAGVTVDQYGQAKPTFSDVVGKYYTDAIALLSAKGIAKGTSTAAFAQKDGLTCAALLTFLGRAEGVTVDNSKAAKGIRADGWSAGYIGWALDNGLITAGQFGQYDVMKKADVNAVLEKYNKKFSKAVPAYAASLSDDASRGSFAILLAASLSDSAKNVKVEGGEISGIKSVDGKVNIYKGIPYAAAPVGDLRWKAPQPVTAWSGVKPCITFGPSAIQAPQAPFMMWTEEFMIEDTGYSEDCLSLNVWTADDSAKDKPVIVYVHGGGFTSGGSSCEVYDGEYMAEAGTVFVNINYRVGALGYMATSDLSAESPDGVSGNYGLQDQIAALKWVQNNIAQFGGDPKNVTIMGQSAGGASINALVMSPLTKGMFKNALAESFNNVAAPLATLKDLETANDKALQGKSLKDLRALSATDAFALQVTNSMNIDGHVLTAQMGKALESGVASDVTFVSGMVTGDSLLFGLIPFGAPDSLEAYEGVVKTTYGDKADKVLKLYPATSENFAQVYGQLSIDLMMAQQNLVAKARKNSTADTYIYLFSHVMPGRDGGMFGAFHTSEVPYFLHIFSNYRADLWKAEDYAMGDTMSGYLLNLAKTGNPNGGGLTKWAPAAGEYDYFTLDTTCENSKLSQEKMDLFNDLLG